MISILENRPSVVGLALLREALPEDPFLSGLGEVALTHNGITELLALEKETPVGVIWIGSGWDLRTLIEHTLRRPKVIFRLFLRPRALKSMLAMLLRPRFYGKPSELLYMAVSAPARSKGLGRKIVSVAIERGTLVEGTWVNTLSDSRSKSFYTSVGFRTKHSRLGRVLMRYEP